MTRQFLTDDELRKQAAQPTELGQEKQSHRGGSRGQGVAVHVRQGKTAFCFSGWGGGLTFNTSLHTRNRNLTKNQHLNDYINDGNLYFKYNLDQGVSGMDGGFPAEILDEIRQAESLRSSSSPHSPVKDKSDLEGPSSPPPLPQPPPVITADDRQQGWIQSRFRYIYSLHFCILKGGSTEFGPELTLVLGNKSHDGHPS